MKRERHKRRHKHCRMLARRPLRAESLETRLLLTAVDMRGDVEHQDVADQGEVATTTVSEEIAESGKSDSMSAIEGGNQVSIPLAREPRAALSLIVESEGDTTSLIYPDAAVSNGGFAATTPNAEAPETSQISVISSVSPIAEWAEHIQTDFVAQSQPKLVPNPDQNQFVDVSDNFDQLSVLRSSPTRQVFGSEIRLESRFFVVNFADEVQLTAAPALQLGAGLPLPFSLYSQPLTGQSPTETAFTITPPTDVSASVSTLSPADTVHKSFLFEQFTPPITTPSGVGFGMSILAPDVWNADGEVTPIVVPGNIRSEVRVEPTTTTVHHSFSSVTMPVLRNYEVMPFTLQDDDSSPGYSVAYEVPGPAWNNGMIIAASNVPQPARLALATRAATFESVVIPWMRPGFASLVEYADDVESADSTATERMGPATVVPAVDVTALEQDVLKPLDHPLQSPDAEAVTETSASTTGASTSEEKEIAPEEAFVPPPPPPPSDRVTQDDSPSRWRPETLIAILTGAFGATALNRRMTPDEDG